MMFLILTTDLADLRRWFWLCSVTEKLFLYITEPKRKDIRNM